MVLRINIVGNIGAGKSTVMQEMRTVFDENPYTLGRVHIMCEPIDKWTAAMGPANPSPLQELYADPSRNAFAFQMYALQTRLAQQLQAVQKKDVDIVLIERDCLASVDVFAEDMLSTGCLNDMQLFVYNDMREFGRSVIASASGPSCDRVFTVYLRTDPNACMARIQGRGRSEECAHITADYLHRLHALHEKHYCGSHDTRNAHSIMNDTIVMVPVDASTYFSSVNPPREIAREVVSQLMARMVDV
jgi:deoxyadenosine/deoxycytidine kinase